eukprot:1145147-Pelagomonas_calceolata.AAC.2
MLVPFPDGPCSDYTIYNDYTLAPLVELGLSDIMQASWLQAKLQSLTKTLNTRHIILSGERDSQLFEPMREKKRKVYAGHRPRALRKGPLTSKLARASPAVPQNYTSYS